MMSDNVNAPLTRLLTLLNVSATKATKRKRDDEFVPSEKLNKRKSLKFALESELVVSEGKNASSIEVIHEKEIVEDGVDDVENDGELAAVEQKRATKPTFDATIPPGAADSYELHFGVQPSILSEVSRNSVESRAWKLLKERSGKLGTTVLSVPDSAEASTNSPPQVDVVYYSGVFWLMLNRRFRFLNG